VQSSDGGDVADHKEPVVFWSPLRTAFTLPGRYIYLSRSLLEEPLPEDAVAFVFAHEIAHQRLGHMRATLPALRVVRRVPGIDLVSLLVQRVVRAATSPEQERSADDWALDRALDVGYDGRACLVFFRVLRKIAIDHGDFDMACGPGDPERHAEHVLDRDINLPWQNAFAELATRARALRWERLRGYPSLPERQARLEARLAAR
jgi:Zn-dependent protease with chaperone function